MKPRSIQTITVWILAVSVTLGCPRKHSIQSGETLFTIARHYATTTDEINLLNADQNLDWTSVSPGDVICVPASDASVDGGATFRRRTAGPAQLPSTQPPSESVENMETCSITPSAIVGGVETRPHAWPWQVLIRMAAADGSFPENSFCGGVLIGNQTILTAAHCIKICLTRNTCLINNKGVAEYRIGLGVHKRSKFTNWVNISKIYVHKDYNYDNGNRNDIALMKLAEPARFWRKVKPIRLPDEKFRLCEGADVIITGWGSVDVIADSVEASLAPKVFNYSDVLRQGKVKVLNSAVCSKAFDKVFSNATMLCAGVTGGGIDACQGDSGGPLVVYDPRAGTPTDSGYVLAGLVSWGVGCGAAGSPGVYTNIPAFLPWIRQMQKRGQMDGY